MIALGVLCAIAILVAVAMLRKLHRIDAEVASFRAWHSVQRREIEELQKDISLCYVALRMQRPSLTELVEPE